MSTTESRAKAAGPPSSAALAPRRAKPRSRFALKLRHKAMLAIVAVVSALMLMLVASVESIERQHVVERVEPELKEVGRSYLKFQESQFRLLQVIARNLVDSPRVRGALEEVLEQPAKPGEVGEAVLPPALAHSYLDVMAEGLRATQADLAMVTSASFRVLARARRGEREPVFERLPAAGEVSLVDARGATVRDPRGGTETYLAPAGNLLLCGGEMGGLADLPGQRLHDGSPGTPLAFDTATDDPLRPPPACYWSLRGQLFQICATPLSVPARPGKPASVVGWFAFGFRISDGLAAIMKGVLRHSVLMVLDDQLVGCSESTGAFRDAALAACRRAKWSAYTSRTLGPYRTAQLVLQDFSYATMELPLGQSGARLLIMMSLEQALEPFSLLRNRLYMTALWVLGLALAMSWVLGRGLVRPIETLGQGMRRVADGDLKLQLAVSSNDELGELAESFNIMVQGLYEREHLSRMVSQSALGRVRQAVEGGDSYEVAKRIEVTVLFSDVRDFTTMSEKLSAEEVVRLLNEHFEEVGRIIARHGGDIDKFIGDAVMAVFTGTEQRDHAEAAVLAAMEMQDMVRRKNEERRAAGRLTVDIGVGLNSGSVVHGMLGTQERMEIASIGDVVNVASRLESCCKQGKHLKIVISESTHERVRHLVDAELMSETRVKGKSTEVLMYEIRGLARREDFLEGLAATDPARRLSNARIMSRFANADEVAAILALLSDPQGEVRRGIAEIVPHLTHPADKLAAALCAALESERDAVVAVALLDALARVGDHRMVDALTPYGKDERRPVRAAAIRALGQLGGSGAAAALAAHLLEDDASAVSAAAGALLALGRWDALHKLTVQLSDPSPARRAAAARAVADAAPLLADRRLAVEINRRRDPASVWFIDELANLTSALTALDKEPAAQEALARLS